MVVLRQLPVGLDRLARGARRPTASWPRDTKYRLPAPRAGTTVPARTCRTPQGWCDRGGGFPTTISRSF